MVGDTYTFKQMVRLEPFYIKVRAEQGPMITDPGPPNQKSNGSLWSGRTQTLHQNHSTSERTYAYAALSTLQGERSADTNWGTSPNCS